MASAIPNADFSVEIAEFCKKIVEAVKAMFAGLVESLKAIALYFLVNLLR